jgi:glycosyltransferase involved in cell wall biosynthesis
MAKKSSAKKSKSKNRISVCIIAKNEEASILNCLNSVKDIAYEIIVLDTGSTDKTKEIVGAFHGTHLHETTWDNDFSKARNECISHATGDWVLIMDSDEVITEETQKQIIPFLEMNEKTIDKNVVFGFKNINESLKEREIKYHGYKHTMFRNNMGIKYKHKVHEHLYHPDINLFTLNLNNLVIIHNDMFKPSDYLITKNYKYSYMLLELIKKNIETNDTDLSEKNKLDNKFDLIYYWYQLGNTYHFLKETEKAVNAYYQAFNLFDEKLIKVNVPFYVNILNSFFHPLCELKKFLEALSFIDQFMTFLPDFPDAFYYKAFCLQNMGEIETAVTYYQQALELIKQKKFSNQYSVISLEDTLLYLVLNEFSKCLLILGHSEKSLEIAHFLNTKLTKSFPIKVNLIKNLVLNDNLYEIYEIANDLTASLVDKNKLAEIIKLAKTDLLYKNFQVQLLEKILRLEGITTEERSIFFGKIDSLL